MPETERASLTEALRRAHTYLEWLFRRFSLLTLRAAGWMNIQLFEGRRPLR
jgi:hypothetical protein